MQNVSIQAFQSNVIYAIFQTFNPREKINLLQQFKISPIPWKKCGFGNPASNTSSIQRDLNTQHIDGGSLMRKNSIQHENVCRSRPWWSEIGSGLKKSPVQGFNTKMHTMNGDCRKQKLNFDILSDLEIPAGRIFLGPKRGHVRGKEDVWSLYYWSNYLPSACMTAIQFWKQ